MVEVSGVVSVGTAAHTRAECNARQAGTLERVGEGERLFLQVPSLHTHSIHTARTPPTLNQSTPPFKQTINDTSGAEMSTTEGGAGGGKDLSRAVAFLTLPK